MIQDKEKEFDLIVKSMLSEAEEEVPSRVWDAIDARLPQRSPAPVWWKWAGITFAAAAMALLALILGGTFHKPSIDIIPQNTTRVADIPPVSTTNAAEPAVEEEPSRPAFSIDRKNGKPTAVVEKTTPAVDDMEAEKIEAEDINESFENTDETPANTGDATEVKEEKPSHSAIEGKDINWDTYFDEDANRTSGKKKITVDFGGILGSNDGVSKTSILPGIEAAPSIDTYYTTGISESSSSLYGIPLTFGFGLRFYLTEKISLGTGLNYSLLTRSFKGDYIYAENGNIVRSIDDADIINHIHYIGIPINAYYDIIQTNLIRFYAFGGGTFEKGVGSNFRINGKGVTENFKESVPGIQASAALGMGIQFNVAKSWSLYLDPSARYYFNCNQPKSVRTQKPFMFNFEVGVRYNL